MRTLKRKDIKAYKEALEQQRDPITYEVLSNIVLDHCHTTGRIRRLLDRNTNQMLGKTESAFKRFLGYKKDMITLPEILRNMASYIERDYAHNPYHPSWADLQVRKFSRCNKALQESMLLYNGVAQKEIGKTSKERTKQFKKWFYED